jgi:hypothetical protein
MWGDELPKLEVENGLTTKYPARQSRNQNTRRDLTTKSAKIAKKKMEGGFSNPPRMTGENLPEP